MASDFTHDDDAFERGSESGGVEIADAEARYATLFAETIWDGVISPARRARLNTAAELWGVSIERAKQIEAALIVSHQNRHQVAIVEEEEDLDLSEPEIAPDLEATNLADPSDPGGVALQRRVEMAESRAADLEQRCDRQAEHIEQLEALVSQLQFALESTMDDLDLAARRVAELEEGESRVSRTGSRPPPPMRPPAETVEVEESLDVSIDTDLSLDEKLAVDVSLDGSDDITDIIPPSLGRPATVAEVDEAPDIPPPAHSRMQARSAHPNDPLLEELREAQRQREERNNPADIHRAFSRSPEDVAQLHALFDSLRRGDDLDQRWCVSHALVFAGQAEAHERELHEAHARDGLVRPTRAVNDDEWRELLYDPSEDRLTGEILSVIAPAMLLGHLTAMRASIAPAVLEQDTRVDPKTSTLQAVRCLDWAAAIVGLKTPSIHVCPEFAGTADIVLNPAPTTRLGGQALKGRDSRELAFIAGRHLTWYRREHLLGRPNRSVRRLEDMFLAALRVANPRLPLSPDVEQRVQPIARSLQPLLDAAAVEKLQTLFQRFVEAGGRTNLTRWLAGAERTAVAAGALLAGDLFASKRMLELEAGLPMTRLNPREVARAEREMLVFFTSARCSSLRRRIGIAVTG